MQNVRCKMNNEIRQFFISYFALNILHFAFLPFSVSSVPLW